MVKTKKLFYYKIESEKRNRTYGGQKVTASVYKMLRGALKYIGQISWDTRSFKGEESEVFTYLIEKKQLPKKAYDWSKSKHSSGGYYQWSFRDEYGVEIKRL